MPKPAAASTIIHAKTLFSGGRQVEDRWLVLEGGMIVEVSKKKLPSSVYSGIVTPAFVDPHSHIGMIRAGEPDGENEGNDTSAQIQPLHDPVRSIYFDDAAFDESVDFGVLYSCVLPGSGNLFGGRSKVIRNFASHVGECEVLDYGYKMALGYNPRSTGGWKGERPNTRMGLYAMLEKRFDEVLAKSERSKLTLERKTLEIAKRKLSKGERQNEEELIRREANFDLTPEDRAILEVVTGKRPVKIHVHKEDDIYYLVHLKKKYGLKVSAEHCGDVFHQEVFEMLRDNKIPVVFGPLGSHAYKVELRHSTHRAAKMLMDSGVEFGLMTDHPVIQASLLRDSLRYFLMYGMSNAEALDVISGRNASLVGIGKRFGRLEEGMAASILVWDKDPLHLGAYPRVVIGEGNILRDRKF
jgi:imidazolonepropionase-like amidohydrolase